MFILLEYINTQQPHFNSLNVSRASFYNHSALVLTYSQKQIDCSILKITALKAFVAKGKQVRLYWGLFVDKRWRI